MIVLLTNITSKRGAQVQKRVSIYKAAPTSSPWTLQKVTRGEKSLHSSYYIIIIDTCNRLSI